MKWTTVLGRTLAKRLSPEEIVNVAMDIWPLVWERIPHERRVPFLTQVVAKHLGALLGDMERAERATLMNALLPVIAREFPLTEADFLSAFASPGDRYAPQAPS